MAVTEIKLFFGSLYFCTHQTRILLEGRHVTRNIRTQCQILFQLVRNLLGPFFVLKTINHAGGNYVQYKIFKSLLVYVHKLHLRIQ